MQTLVHAWLALVIDVSIKSLLLAAIAGLGLFVFRIRDTNLRHRVWTAVLLGMLVMPALVHVIPSIPLPDWMTVDMLNDREESVAAEQPAAGRSLAITPVGATEAAQSPRVADFPASELPNSAIDGRQPLPSNEPQRLTQTNVPQTSAIANSKPAATPPKPTMRAADRLPLVLASLYFAVAAMLSVRLLIGLALARRLIAQAREIGWPRLMPLPRRRLRLLESGQVHVPATLGSLRPVVLLPEGWRIWTESKLRAVLAHELAHVRRADWLVITLADLNRAIYWFHPLAWFLRRRLSELAERNCDDAVLEAEQDRTQYARHLLEVASSLATAGSRYRQPVSGVAMARKPNVETRIDAILDAGRPLARRLSAIGLAALVACGAIAILVSAAIRTSAEDKPQKPEAEMKMKGPESPQAGKSDQAADKKQSAGDPKQQHATGRVLDPNGKPVAGATVCVAWTLTGPDWFIERKETIVAKTKSDAQGAFELEFSLESPEPKRVSQGWKIIAIADGFSPAWQRDVHVVKNGSPNSVVTLTLTQDKPVRGRIVDLEGTPLAGIHVRVHALYAAPSEQAIADWIQDAKKKPPPRNFEEYSSYAGGSMMSHPSRFAGPFPFAWNDGFLPHGSLALPADSMTDSDGRIEFKPLGVNRLAILEIEGKAIAKNRVQVVIRDMATVSAEPLNKTGVRSSTYFGRDFQFVAEPTQPIVGTVKDAKTNEPLVNLRVNVDRVAGNPFGEQDFLSARTNDQGQYRIDGAPRGGGHVIAVNPTPDQPYFPTEKTLKTVSGLEPITCDFALSRGRWITGKVIDHETKAPIKGAMIDCLPLRSNPNVKDYPNYDPNIVGHAPSYRYFTSDDGSFRVLAVPGKGILGGIAMKDDEHTYASLNKESVPKKFVQANGYLTTYDPWTITGYHAIKEVEIPESNEIAKCDLEFTRGLSRVVEIVDAQGKPVVGVRVLGRVFPPRFEQPASGSSVKVIGIRSSEEREVFFIHPERKIGKAIKVSAGDETMVELQPCAVARGRVVNEDRQPVPGLPVNVHIVRADNWSRELLGTTTGEDGRFEVLLSPGTTYHVSVYIPSQISVSAECRATPGANFELGDLTNGTKLKADQTEKMVTRLAENVKSEAAAPKSEKPATGESTKTKHSTIHGRVTGVYGKPAADADVAVIAWRKDVGRFGDLEPDGVVLAEAKTDSDGKYQIELAGVSSKTHRDANVIARTSGTALAWQVLNLDAADVEASFELQPEEMISCRVVNIEGQPAANVPLQLTALMLRVPNDQRTHGRVGLFTGKSQRLPAAWPKPVLSDNEGRFVVVGVAKNQGAYLYVEGTDSFAPQDLSLNTGIPEQRGDSNSDFPTVSRNVKIGEEAAFALAPAQMFSGTVRYEDTGEAAPHARLTIWSSLRKGGGMLSVAGQADENGRYKINPRQGTYFGVNAYPPDHTPYLVRQMRFIPWDNGARAKVVDVTLPRGVLVKGKVLDQGSEAPIRAAYVQYLPGAANRIDRILTGWTDMHLTDDRGQFEIAVPPGPGNIAVRAPRDEYVFQEKSDGELLKGQPGGERKYAHGFKRIEPALNSAPMNLDFHLKRGATVSGELVDAQGGPIEQAAIISRLNVDVRMMDCNTFPAKATGGRFEISSLAPGEECPVHFLDAKRRLGAAVTIKGGMPPARVALEPCGSVKMRFVDPKGEPMVKCEPSIHMVVTPGAFDRFSLNSGLQADTVFVQNIDRVNHPQREIADDHGCLTVSALIPGATYHIELNNFAVSKEFKATAGETIDLGDITVEKLTRQATSANKGSASLGETRSRDRSAIHGRVVGVDGKPAVGADVAVIARRNSIGRGGDLASSDAVLGETKTDSDGRYEIELSGVSSKTHQNANLIARTSGAALAWRRLNVDVGDVEASFDLKPEQPILGKLVDIEGQPAAGVRFQVASLMARVSSAEREAPADGIAFSEWYSHNPHLPAAWPQVVESDRDGRFTIHGIPKEHGVFLQVQGDDRFAPQSLLLNTGRSEQRGERDATYRSQVVKNLKSGEEATLPLAPAQIFTGTVRYEDTGDPAPRARLTIWASQQKFGSMISIGGKADENGRYKIIPHPGIRFGVAAYPPDDAPYLVRQLEPISWEGGERTKTVDVTLPRGALVRGKVVEEGTDSPVVGASVQYAPEEANNPNKSDKILTGWQDIHLSDRDGRFQIAVLPGPGRLLIHGPTNEFVVRETSERELDRGKPGWRRDYVHGIERIEPAAKSPPLEVTIRLKRSKTVRGELVDEQGAPVDEVQMLSQLEVHPYSLNWRGSSVEARGGRFELSGLANDRDYPVHFLQAKRRLGATTTVRAGMAEPRVVLEPCGGAKMRFVDDKSKPVGKFEPIVQLVMTPGELQYSEAAMKSGAFTADAVWLSNFDRVNHPSFEKADDDGRFTAAALIPGATYQVVTFHKGRDALSKEFQAVAKETIDLGDIVVERKE